MPKTYLNPLVMAKNSKKKDNYLKWNKTQEFKMNINSFGEISSSFSIDKINAFLNKNVDDKKLRDREEDIDEKKK